MEITSAGVHTLNLWMREDGAIVDMIVLTTDSVYTLQHCGNRGESALGLPTRNTWYGISIMSGDGDIMID